MLIKDAVYGIPNLPAKIRTPSSSPIGLLSDQYYPGTCSALKKKLIEVSTIIADSASGVSGRDGTAKRFAFFCEVDGGLKHTNREDRIFRKLSRELNALAGKKFCYFLYAAFIAGEAGILSTIYATLKKDISLSELHSLISSFYAEEKFVRYLSGGDLS